MHRVRQQGVESGDWVGVGGEEGEGAEGVDMAAR